MNTIPAIDIPLLKNFASEALCDYTDKDTKCDLHNNYSCTELSLSDGNIQLKFIRPKDNGDFVIFIFHEVSIEEISIQLGESSIECDTIGQLYRGMGVVNNIASEIMDEKYAYLYIDMLNGTYLNFWCKSVDIITN